MRRVADIEATNGLTKIWSVASGLSIEAVKILTTIPPHSPPIEESSISAASQKQADSTRAETLCGSVDFDFGLFRFQRSGGKALQKESFCFPFANQSEVGRSSGTKIFFAAVFPSCPGPGKTDWGQVRAKVLG